MDSISKNQNTKRNKEMDRQAILNDLKKEYGSFPTISDISRYLKISRASVRDLMNGVECLPDGRSKKYFAGDVADKIYKNRSM